MSEPKDYLNAEEKRKDLCLKPKNCRSARSLSVCWLNKPDNWRDGKYSKINYRETAS